MKQQVNNSMPSWKYVWRNGFSKVMSKQALEALRDGLQANDPRLIQGATTSPPPLMCVADWPCEGGCLIAFSGWQGEGKAKVGEVEEYFAEICFNADLSLGQPAACRWLLNWYDDTDRSEMIRELLPEVELAIAQKENSDAPRQETTN